MAILDRLPIQDRLQRMGMNVEQRCLMCEIGLESRDYLFGYCTYSRQVWTTILCMCNIEREVYCWDMELQWLCAKLKGKSLLVFVLKLGWSSFVYHVWEERNRRKFRSLSRDVGSLLDSIRESIQLRVQNSHILLNDINRKLCDNWRIFV
ncbi:hypothetical protein GQ457_13G008320 [Hibiscus cannabinus]